MKRKPLTISATIDEAEDDLETGGSAMSDRRLGTPLELNTSAVAEDGTRKREMTELAEQINAEREMMSSLKPNDPRWTNCFSRLNALLSKRDQLKDS